MRSRLRAVLLVFIGGLLGTILTIQLRPLFVPLELRDPTSTLLGALDGVGPSDEELREIHRYFYLTPWAQRYEELLAQSEQGDSRAMFLIGYLIENCSGSDTDTTIGRWAKDPSHVVNLEYGFPRFIVGLMAYRRESCRGIEAFLQENEYNTFFREEGERWRKKAATAGNSLAVIPRFIANNNHRQQALQALEEHADSSLMFAIAVEYTSSAFIPDLPRMQVSTWSQTANELFANYDARRSLLNVDSNAWLLLRCFYSQHKCDLHDQLRGMAGFTASDFDAIAKRTIELDQLLKAGDWSALRDELR